LLLNRPTAYKKSGVTATQKTIHASKNGSPKTCGSVRFTSGTANVSMNAGITATA